MWRRSSQNSYAGETPQMHHSNRWQLCALFFPRFSEHFHIRKVKLECFECSSPDMIRIFPFYSLNPLPSEKELTNCSLQVLDPAGSPSRTLLAWLADRCCSLDFLLHCLRKMNHQEAVQFLTTTGRGKKCHIKVCTCTKCALFTDFK